MMLNLDCPVWAKCRGDILSADLANTRLPSSARKKIRLCTFEEALTLFFFFLLFLLQTSDHHRSITRAEQTSTTPPNLRLAWIVSSMPLGDQGRALYQ
mmetsp:Transcript_71565/g.149636  ORF Transcript_71565/g.149636 Transcript_71565/m.149636 type:complete len:98 (-) Transcript_71565:482-775(-)